MARRLNDEVSRPPQVTRPHDGDNSPMATRRNVVLPEPLGPIRIVGAPCEMWIEMRSRMVTPPTIIPTSGNSIGKSADAPRFIPRSAHRHGERPEPGR